MRKEDMVRLFIETFPEDRLSLLLKQPDLFFFRAFCNGIFMTLQTGGYIRHSGEGLVIDIWVAGGTFQPLFEMPLVVERDWLGDFGVKTKTDE